ncbi:holo-ACP synthase [Celerinatantimonas sp. YJH-8]|uniref:holo-ACP synthase n=1 Tax=Celerinatantimonas sp. YJH-8 TaxID=3228714 RepID=UPI0038C22A44
MAVVGLGTDIIQIDRIVKSSVRLAQRILAEDEFLCWQSHPQPVRFLAKRFAAKEAAAKALGTGIAQGVTFQDFIVRNDAAGKPYLTLTGKAAQIAAEKAIDHWFLSISDERNYALATVIGERSTC